MSELYFVHSVPQMLFVFGFMLPPRVSRHGIVIWSNIETDLHTQFVYCVFWFHTSAPQDVRNYWSLVLVCFCFLVCIVAWQRFLDISITFDIFEVHQRGYSLLGGSTRAVKCYSNMKMTWLEVQQKGHSLRHRRTRSHTAPGTIQGRWNLILVDGWWTPN